MADLRDSPPPLRGLNKLVRFVKGWGQGLFNQDINALLHQSQGNFHMVNRRHGYGSSLNFAMGRRELFDGTERQAAKLARNCIGACPVTINHSDQSHCLAVLGKLLINASVIAAKRACTDDGDVDESVSYQYSVPAGDCGILIVIIKTPLDHTHSGFRR